jgi:hypothetical protein
VENKHELFQNPMYWLWLKIGLAGNTFGAAPAFQ